MAIEKTTTFKKPIGKTGTSISGGVYDADHISSLTGYQASDEYNKMRRSDPKIRGILTAIFNPIKRAGWEIEAVSDDKKDLEAAALMRQIIFKDIGFQTKLHEILMFIVHGFSVFEMIHENKIDNAEFGPYTGLKSLSYRKPETLIKWEHDEATGELKFIEQQSYGDVSVSAELPAENLVIFFNEKEGDDNGFSLLRPLYGPYKRKLLCEELKIIGIERAAIPTPTAKVPANVKSTDTEYANMQTILENFTSNENAYLMYPEGWELELNQNTFNPEAVQSSIKSENEEMAHAVVATFLELGVGKTGGAYALGKDLSDFFLEGIEYFAHLVAEPINNQIIPNLMFHNYGDTISVYPELTFSGISDKAGKELMQVVTGYTTSGVVTIDERLEDYVRKVNNLPKKAEGEMLDNQESVDASGAPSPKDENEKPDGEPREQGVTPETDDELDDNVELSENEKFAEPKTPTALINKGSDRVHDLMKEKLQFTADKMTADIIRNYRQLSDESKIKALDNVKPGGQAQFRRSLKGVLGSITAQAIEQAKKEVPGKSDVKLKDREENIKFLTEAEIKKLNKELRTLPKHVRELLIRQASTVSEKQIEDLSKRVSFQFMSSNETTKDVNRIKQDIEDAASEYIDSSAVKTAATNIVSTMTNSGRNAFLFDDEVMEDVASYTFTNPDPKSPICQKLTGRVFATNDAQFFEFAPPLHHNCKSYIRANLKTSKNLPEVSGLPTITETERKSITFSEGCSCS